MFHQMIQQRDIFLLSLIILLFPLLSGYTIEKPFDLTNTNHLNQQNIYEDRISDTILTTKQQVIRKPKLKADTSTASAPWSNAFNFSNVWGSQVNPGTGLLSSYIKVGSLLSNKGHGPDIDLVASYSSGALADPDGLGIGWSFNLTHFNPITNQLTTSVGQCFFLQQNRRRKWYPLYHKLHDIEINGSKDTHFTITYPNGLREILNHDGYEIRLEQQDGNNVVFMYEPGSNHLLAVKDNLGKYLLLQWKENRIAVISIGNKGQPVAVQITKKNGKLHSVSLPLLNDAKKLGVYIHYVSHLITQMDYPTGLKKTITYNCKDAIKTPFPPQNALCAVSRETVKPGAGQPPMKTRYKYMQISTGEHNYLGFNAGLPLLKSAKRDVLFDAPANYTYRTLADNGIVKEIRTYNKYHLLIDDQLMSDRSGYKLSEIHNFFCRTDREDGCAHTGFKDLPVTYSLPLKVVTKVWSNPSEQPAVSIVSTTYDNEGRAISAKDVYGRVSYTKYCPLKGDDYCPAAPESWPFSTLTESVIQYPASIDTDNISPPDVVTHNYYQKQYNRQGKGYILILHRQSIQAAKQKITTIRRYYNDHNNMLTYGLLSQTVLTDNQPHSLELKSIIKHYYYIENRHEHSKSTYTTVDIGDGKTQKSSVVTTSLFTNQVLQNADPMGKNITRYHYDLWGRLVQTDLAVGTPFATNVHYYYFIFPEHNEIRIQAANGLQQKILLDGAGRALISFREAVSTAGKGEPGRWLPTSKKSYDVYGRIKLEQSYLFDSVGTMHTLAVTHDYDDSGRVIHTYLSDGEIITALYDDAKRCMVSFQQDKAGKHSVIFIVRANVLDQPVEQIALPATNDPLPTTAKLCDDSDKRSDAKISTRTYDGFGRVIVTKDPSGRVVKQHYDAMGRLIETIDPAGNRIHPVFDLAGNTIQTWTYPATGGQYLLASAAYNAARQTLWQAGEDGRKTFFTYNQNGQLVTTIKPTGDRFTLQYNVLGLPVSKWVNGQLILQTRYDHLTTLPATTTDITGTTTYTYSDDGLLQHLSHTGNSFYPNYKFDWQYDKNRRIVSVTDISDNKTEPLYDHLGRVTEALYLPKKGNKEVLSSVVYDGFSRVVTAHYGSGMQRIIEYDHWGHPHQITDTLAGDLLSQWQFNYNIDDNITTLTQNTSHHQYATLHYGYDVLDNLTAMTCKGSAGLPLCPRDTAFVGSGLKEAPVITRQHYTFTHLNRMAKVEETVQDLLRKNSYSKAMRYAYTNRKIPLRLQEISTAWNHKRSVPRRFIYDISGNMTTDGQGNKITYNVFDQITSVTQNNGQQSYYTYDGTGKKIVEKSTVGTSYLFYRGENLINEKIISSKQKMHIIGYQAVAKTIDGTIHEYHENNYRGDVTAVLRKQKNGQYSLSQYNLYSPYGMVRHSQPPASLPLYKQTLQGFDGERTDPATGWQFLGNGNRTYNPEQRYFVSEDTAGDGYAFGDNNPVMNSDPSGNMPRWLGSAMKWGNYINTLGLGAVHKRWAAITGSVVALGLTAFASGGGNLLAGMSNALFACGLSVASSAAPANKGLNIAAAITGAVDMAVMAVGGFAGLLLPESITSEAAISVTEIKSVVTLPFCMLSARSNSVNVDAVITQLLDLNNLHTVIPDPDFAIEITALLNGPPIRFTPGLLTQYFMAYFFSHIQPDPFQHSPFLSINSLETLGEAWKFLRGYPLNAQCDTGTILAVAYMTGNAIALNELDNFLVIREAMGGGSDFATLSGNSNYILSLGLLLQECSGSRALYHLAKNPVTYLANIFKKEGDTYVLSNQNHIMLSQFVAQGEMLESRIYKTFIFNDNGSFAIIEQDRQSFMDMFRYVWSDNTIITSRYKIRTDKRL